MAPNKSDPSDRTEVTAYILAWHPDRHEGSIRLHLAKKGSHDVATTSAAEFVAMVAVLKEAPVYLCDDGTLTTGWEPVHDGD